MYKDVWKRMTAFILCACMIGTSVDLGGLTVYAAEQEQTSETQNLPDVEEDTQAAEEDAQKEEGEVQTSEEENTQEPDSGKDDASKNTNENTQTAVTGEEAEQSDSDVQNAPFAENAQTFNISVLPKRNLYAVTALGDGTTINFEDSANAVDFTYDGSYSLTYDGTQKKPTVQVAKCNGITLIEGTDFKVNYGTNTEVDGTIDDNYVEIIGINNYTGSFKKELSIKAFNLSNAQITMGATTIGQNKLPNQTYTGSPIEPDITVSAGGKVLPLGSYKISYPTTNHTDVGTAQLVIESADNNNNCSGTKTLSYTIVARSLEAENGFSYEYNDSWVYTGSEIKPDVTIKYNGVEIPNTNYTVSYTNNTKVGIGKITITGNGNFTNTITKVFTIAGKAMRDCDITLSQDSYVYNGTAHKPEVTVKDGTKELVEGLDYTLTYENNVDAGTATVTVKGEGNYGEYMPKKYTIQKCNIATPQTTGRTFRVNNISNQVYDGGNEIKPTVTVVDNLRGDMTLGVDYQCSFENNTSKGTATVTIDGINNYDGTLTKTFEIIAVDLDDVTIADIPNWTVVGSKPEPSLTVTYNGRSLRLGQDYSVKYVDSNGIELTEQSSEINAYAVITDGTNGNYTGENRKIFWVCGNIGDAITAETTKDSYEYTGEEIEPTLRVYSKGNIALQKDVDYEIQYRNHTDAGTQTMHLVGKGKYAGSKDVDLVITPKSFTNLARDFEYTIENPTYTGEAVRPEISLKLKSSGYELIEGRDFELEEKTDVDYVNVQGGKNLKITVQAVQGGTGNFTDSSEVSFKIQAKSLGSGVPLYTKADDVDVSGIQEGGYAYTGVEIDPTLTISVNGQTLAAGTDYDKTITDYLKAGEATITITGKGNYTGSFKEHFDIKYPLDDTTNGWVTYATLDNSGAEEDEFVYQVTPIHPDLKIAFVDFRTGVNETLSTSDYRITGWANCTDVGDATVTIEGQGKYMGTLVIPYKIVPKPINSLDIIWDEYIKIDPYNGLARNPQTQLGALYNGKKLTQDDSFDITYYEDSGDSENDQKDPTTGSQCINAGDVRMTIKGKGNYDGELTRVFFTIPQKDIRDADITLAQEPEDKYYDGKSHVLTEDDITLNYHYYYIGTSGTVENNLVLNSDKNHTDFIISSIKDSGDSAEEAKEEKSQCINAGDVTVTLKGQGNYKEERTVSYKILPKPINDGDSWASTIDASILVDGEVKDSVIYNREVQNPTIEIKDNSIMDPDTNTPVILEKDKDYQVTWKREKEDGTFEEVTECKDAGTYQIVIDGMGNYGGSYYKTYTIEPRDLENGGTYTDENGDHTYLYAADPIADKVYTGSPVILNDLRVFEYNQNSQDNDDKSDETYVLKLNTDYTIETQNDIDVSILDQTPNTVGVVEIKGSGNYKGSFRTSFIIIPKNITDNTEDEAGNKIYDVSLGEWTEEYNGQQHWPELPLTYNGMTLKQYSDENTNYDYKADYEVEVESEEEGGTPTKILTNINAGPVYGTITGHGNYTETREFTAEDPIFRILPRPLDKYYQTGNSGDIKVNELSSAVYDGLPHKPDVEVTDSIQATPLKEGAEYDYTVEYSDVINAGEQTATIIGCNNYGSSIDIPYTILPKELNNSDGTLKDGATAQIVVEDWTYTGFEIRPKMEITDTIKRQVCGEDGEPVYNDDGSEAVEEVVVTLKEGSEGEAGTDYWLSYENNVNATQEASDTVQNPLKAKVIVHFQGNYSGTYSEEFEIQRRDINDSGIDLAPIEEQKYNGKPQQPDVTMTYGATEESEGYTLVRTKDYELAYSDAECIKVGKVTVTITGTGNFKGERKTDYKIVPRPIDAENTPEITVELNTEQSYTGVSIIPEILVKDSGNSGGYTLVEGTDYVVSAGENTKLPGKASIVLTGKGNYQGERIVEFKITGDLGKNGNILPISSQPYTGEDVEPALTVEFAGKQLVINEDYEIVGWENNRDVGIATVTIRGIGEYYTGETSNSFQIAYNISERPVTVTGIANEYTYTSTNIRPKPTKVTYQGLDSNLKTMTEGKDYTLSYKNDVNISTGNVTAQVVITGKGDFMGTYSYPYKIVKKNIANCSFSQLSSFVYDGKEKKPAVTIKNGSKVLVANVDYSLEYEASADAGVRKVIVKGLGNYTGSSIRYFNITVAAPKSLKMSSNSATTIKLSWSSGGKVTGYEIYRLTGKSYKKVGSTKSTTYTDKKLGNSKSYQYKVRAYFKGKNGTVYSGFTSVLKTNTTPATPKISVSATKSKQLKIKWSKLNSADGYEVYQSTSKNGKYTKIKTASKSTTSYTKKKLTSKKKYYYKVRAYKTINGKKVYGSYSSIKYKKVK